MVHRRHTRRIVRRFTGAADPSARRRATVARWTRAATALLVTAYLAACAGPEATTPVTDEMRASALASIERREMPDWNGWELDETERGVRYVELKPGTGRIPDWGNDVRIHYNLWLTNGTLVDSSRETDAQPFSFTVGEGRVVAGWENVVRRMRVGGTYLVVVPPELGYGRRGSRQVPGNATLVFSMELVGLR